MFGPEKLLLKINNVDIDYIKNVTSLFYKQIITSYISTKSLYESSCVTCTTFLINLYGGMICLWSIEKR